MTRQLFGGPAADLTRHFFREFFYLRFLTDTGADSVRRTIIALVAGIFSLFIFFPQLLMARYMALSALPTPEPYRLAVLGGEFFTICVSMFIAGLVAALVCQSVFPDETDYRVLLALPVTRRLIFGTKALALAAFSSIFVAVTVVVFGIGFAGASGGRWAEQSLLLRICAHVVAVGASSLFTGAAVLSVQGVITLASPRGWVRSVSVASQSAMICVLILSLPLIARTGDQAPFIQTRPRLMLLSPPVWFLGLEQTLLGSRDVYFARLAALAGLGFITSIVVVVGCYLMAYRRFDQLTLRSSSAPWRWRLTPAWTRRTRRDGRTHPVEAAVVAFTAATLRRSGLHQFVFSGIVAWGVALTVNRLIGAQSFRWLDTSRFPTAGMIALIATPLVLLFFTVVAVRHALLLPLEVRANWIFRLTEDDATRRHHMDAVERALVGFGVVPCLALTFPFHLVVLGLAKSLLTLTLTTLAGLLLVEIVARKWRRIPFTCTYIPGKRHLVHTMLLAFTTYTLFVNLGSVLIIASLRNSPFFLILTAILLMVVVGIRRYRLADCARAPLEFEDSLPSDLQLIPLSPR
jgi:hypothetical protein